MTPEEEQRPQRPRPLIVVLSPHSNEPKPSTLAHAATGALEGAVGVYGTEPLINRYLHGQPLKNPFKDTLAGHGKKLAIGAAVGGLATAPIGALVERLRRKRLQQKRDIEIASHMHQFANIFEKIALRRKYDLIDKEDEDTKVTAALKGGLIGTGIGVGAGVGATYALPHAASAVGAQELAGKIAGHKKNIGYLLAGLGGNVGGTVGILQALANAKERRRRLAQRREMALRAPGLIELAYSDEEYSPRLRSNYRLDKYQKTVRAREIDRKIANATQAGLLGGAAGAIYPAAARLRNRAAIGAGAGIAGAAALGLASPKDPYGEESEMAKLVQRRTIEAGGIGAIGYGAYKRKQAIIDALKEVRRKGFSGLFRKKL